MTGGTAVILGNTGRNFAAGMSGGIAYIYDLQQSFAAKCNTEMVDLDPLDETDGIVLRQLIDQHASYTGSTVAQFILKDFDNQLQHFVKVFPRDYKKVLQKREKLTVEN
jgi:glutamate synthase (NADPH/NADH) large chain